MELVWKKEDIFPKEWIHQNAIMAYELLICRSEFTLFVVVNKGIELVETTRNNTFRIISGVDVFDDILNCLGIPGFLPVLASESEPS